MVAAAKVAEPEAIPTKEEVEHASMRARQLVAMAKAADERGSDSASIMWLSAAAQALSEEIRLGGLRLRLLER